MKNYIKIIPFLFFATIILSCGKSKLSNKDPKKSPPLFTLTDSSETGFFFWNEVKEDEKINIFTYEYLFNGSGVCVGDINHDSLPDIFMGGSFFGGRLYLNKGNLHFTDISEKAHVFYQGYTTGITMVDINNDEYMDIYICRSLSNDPEMRTNLLLINNHDLTFTDKAAEYGLNDKGFSSHANFFDYDNDGDLDMYLLNHRYDFVNGLTIMPEKERLANLLKNEEDYLYVSDKLYVNNGNGTFSDHTKEAGLANKAFGLSVNISDMNGDGWQDIYVSNDYADQDHLYINQQNGKFIDEIDNQMGHISKNSMGADIADFNNDGLVDLVTLDMMAEDNYRQKQLKGNSPYDLFHLAVEFGLHYQVMRNCLHLNNGNGTFSEIGQLAGISHTDWSWSPLFADFDNDGKKDLFISNGYARDVTDMDYIKYTSVDLISKAGGKDMIKKMDLENSMNSTPVVNYMYKNQGDLTFENVANDWGLTQTSFSNGAVYADLDLDGDLEIIINNYNSPAFLYKNNSRELFPENNYLTIQLKGDKNNIEGIGAKVWIFTEEGMQFQELTNTRGFLSTPDPSLQFGIGHQNFIKKVIVKWPNGLSQMVENVKANQRITLDIKNATLIKDQKAVASGYFENATSQIKPSYSYVESKYIDFKYEPLIEHMHSNKGPFVATGDINGDQLDDFYVGGSAGNSGALFVQNSSGDFVKKEVPDFELHKFYEDGESVFFDCDKDGDKDLYVCSGSNEVMKDTDYQDRLYVNDGKGNFMYNASLLPDIKSNTMTVEPIDVDGDNDLDLFVGGSVKHAQFPYADNSYILINTNGIFAVANLLPNSGDLGIVNDAAIVDLNNDKKNDLLIAGEWMNIICLINENGSFIDKTNEYGLANSAGIWNCLEVADYDGDGDLDFAAGNRGNNTFFKVSETAPGTMYASDFDKNSSTDAIVGYFYNDGKLHPKYNYDLILQQLPRLKKKFNRYADYSKVTLEDLFSQDELKVAKKYLLKHIHTTYFENTGKGFAMHHFPNETQFSFVQDILSMDLNNDGKLDLLMGGNNYGVNVDLGREDASIGLALMGDGKGSWKPLSVGESGFFAEGDVRQIKLLKGSGDSKYVLIARNSGELKLLKFKRGS